MSYTQTNEQQSMTQQDYSTPSPRRSRPSKPLRELVACPIGGRSSSRARHRRLVMLLPFFRGHFRGLEISEWFPVRELCGRSRIAICIGSTTRRSGKAPRRVGSRGQQRSDTGQDVARGFGSGVECYGNCKIGWDFCVGESLLKLLTENKGLPTSGRR